MFKRAVASLGNMVFNNGMTDAELIEHYGGPTKLAALLGWTESGAAQRIHNWRSRGIPAKVKLQYPRIFLLPELAHKAVEQEVA